MTVDQMWAMKVKVLDKQVALKGEGTTKPCDKWVALKGEGTSPVINGWH